MKKLFLFALTAIFICSCSKNGEDNPTAKEDKFSVDQTQLEFKVQKGGVEYIHIESTQNWTLSGGASWCEPDATSGEGAGHKFGMGFTIIDENLTSDSRSTTFTLKSGSESAEITITQAAAPTVNISNAGTLQQVLITQNLLETTELKIRGTLNAADFESLKSVLTLEYLDISDVNLTELPTEAFKRTLITYIILPRTLTMIGNNMFYFSKTERLRMFDEVVTIRDCAFYRSEINTFHGEFHLSANLQTIGKEAFYGCPGLGYMKFPASLETIGAKSFANLNRGGGSYPSLKYIFFEKGSKLKTIGFEAFSDGLACDGVIYMQHCTQVTEFDSYAFKQDLVVSFYLGTKTPPQGGFPITQGDCVESWTVKTYVPKQYVSAYSKIWGRDYGVQGVFYALEDNMPEH